MAQRFFINFAGTRRSRGKTQSSSLAICPCYFASARHIKPDHDTLKTQFNNLRRLAQQLLSALVIMILSILLYLIGAHVLSMPECLLSHLRAFEHPLHNAVRVCLLVSVGIMMMLSFCNAWWWSLASLLALPSRRCMLCSCWCSPCQQTASFLLLC